MSFSRRLMCHFFAFAILGLFLSNSIIASQAVEYRKFDPLNNDVWDPYGVGVLESENLKFAPHHFLHCRWGSFLSRNSPLSEADVSFNLGTGLSPSIHDLIVVDQRLVEWDISMIDVLSLQDALVREGPDGLTKREIYSTTYIDVDDLYYGVDDLLEKKAYYLLKKLEFNKDALNSLPQSVEKIVILIHGWNPDGHSGFYKTGELRKLSNALTDKLGKRSDWSLLKYHWEKDAATGPRFMEKSPVDGPSGHINAPEAGEAAHMHGYHLGELLSQRNLSKVHFIAHSAGTWVARSAAAYLSEKHPNKDALQMQVTLLDPFIPGQLAPPNTSLTKDKIDELAKLEGIKLENYYSVSAEVDSWFEANNATAQWFDEWGRSLNSKQLRVDFGKDADFQLISTPRPRFERDYDAHGGPIVFYTDSILGKLQRPTLNRKKLSKKEFKAWGDKAIGWKNSLYGREHHTPDIKPAPGGNLANNQTAVQVEALGDEIYQVPYAHSDVSTGGSGETCVEFVQKARPELNYGWAEASNGVSRARQEGFEVNALPRVGAAFIDPHAVGAYVGHVGMVTAVTQAQFNGQKYYRLLIDDSDAATYQKIRRDVLMWLRLEADGTVVFDPSIRRDGEKYRLYERGESSRSGPERPILFIHEKVEEYNRKRQELAKFYDLSGGDEVDQIMALRRNLVFYLVDRSGSMKGEGGMLDLRDEVRQRIFEHASNLPANTQVELQFFNSSAGAIKAWHPFKSQNLAQFKAYFEAKFNPDGGTRLFDTVYEAMEHLSGQGLAYNQIEFIIFSDGDDNASGAQAKGKRWKVISPALAQLQQANHFVRTYLFTMGYELAKPDAQTLASMGVEITAVAVEENQKNLEKFDRIELKDGSRYHGKILAKELRFDTNFGSSLVKLGEILSYKSGKLTTRDKFSKAAELSGDDLKIDTAEGSISVPANSVILVETGR